MVKKIKKIELLKITDGTNDIPQATFKTAVRGQTLGNEYQLEQFLLAQGWEAQVFKEVPIKTPDGSTWKNIKANPVQSVITENTTQVNAPTIRIYPIPDANPEYYLLKIYYMREPFRITSTTDTLQLPVSAKAALKYYVAAQALLAEQDPQDYNKAQILMGLYEQQLESLRQTLKIELYDNYEMGYRN